MSLSFKCKSCGAYIEFNPNASNFICNYCGAQYTEDEVVARSAAQEAQVSAPINTPGGEVMYQCSTCGAEIVCDETTSATHCYYCKSPVVLTGKLSDAYKPDKVIPFQIDKQKAQEHFKRFISKKKYIPKDFFTRSPLEELTGVYYPYWDSDYHINASFTGTGTTVSSHVSGDYRISTTKYYNVYRRGNISFDNIFRSALKKNQSKLADGIHPFQQSGEKEYSPAYLAGFLAERRDVDAADIEGSVEHEIDNYIQPLLTRDASYATLSGNTGKSLLSKSFSYVMMPTWVFTYHGVDKETYYFAMNGQSGKTCGKLPMAKGKLLLHSILLGLAGAAFVILGGAFLW